jgi:hypothetical protein
MAEFYHQLVQILNNAEEVPDARYDKIRELLIQNLASGRKKEDLYNHLLTLCESVSGEQEDILLDVMDHLNWMVSSRIPHSGRPKRIISAEGVGRAPRDNSFDMTHGFGPKQFIDTAPAHRGTAEQLQFAFRRSAGVSLPITRLSTGASGILPLSFRRQAIGLSRLIIDNQAVGLALARLTQTTG